MDRLVGVTIAARTEKKSSMPDKQAIQSRAARAAPGKAPILRAGEFVGEQVHNIWKARIDRMITKLKSGGYRLYSRKLDPKTHKRRNLGTFTTLAAAKQHEREVQYFKRQP